ncbi:MAG: DUF3095 domain-containing protein [Balneola sp.]
MKKSVRFYSNLPVLDSFFDISNTAYYHSLPSDWYIGVTDIVNSSKAIDEQKYKWVNILGASPIIGLMNESQKADIPFSFGGDGCSVCFPPEYYKTVKRVFAASKKTGRLAYGMDLRAGIYPISLIRERGFDVKVARFKVSDFYNQAVFIGNGLTAAEALLKSEPESEFVVKSSEIGDQEVDFSGLECRWQEVKKENMSVYSILIQANELHDDSVELYNTVLTKMRHFFDFDDRMNPVVAESLKMTLSPEKLAGETKFRTTGQSRFKKFAYLLKVQLKTILGSLFMKFGRKTSETDWSYYKPDIAINNDYRKFDDMLRLVISCRQDQMDNFKTFLEELYKDSKLAYGIHKSDSALITCMVFAWHRQHLHFVDGSKGGYIMASKDLKARMDRISEGHS